MATTQNYSSSEHQNHAEYINGWTGVMLPAESVSKVHERLEADKDGSEYTLAEISDSGVKARYFPDSGSSETCVYFDIDQNHGSESPIIQEFAEELEEPYRSDLESMLDK
jgi:hypothetical protein